MEMCQVFQWDPMPPEPHVESKNIRTRKQHTWIWTLEAIWQSIGNVENGRECGVMHLFSNMVWDNFVPTVKQLMRVSSWDKIYILINYDVIDLLFEKGWIDWHMNCLIAVR